MNPIQAIILGIVEGITEFLPISSTFHLIFASKFLGIPQTDFAKLFEVVIQAGAIVAVVFLYARTLLEDRDLLQKTIVAFIPTAVIGLVLYKVIKNVFFANEGLMLGVFVLMGLVFLGVEYFIKQDKISLKKEISQLSYKDAVIIGLVQSLAVIPGVSRAGSVIVGMMLLRYKRFEAAKFSFMLSIPTIIAASALDLYKGKDLLLHSGNFGVLAIGFITALIVAYFVVNWLISYLQRNTLTAFGWYRLVFGLILLFFSK